MGIIARIALGAAAKVFGFVVLLRETLYSRGVLPIYRSSLPVICVGNITAGGNGKTPLCLCIARELTQRGIRVVLLSRGYGGTERRPRRVDPLRDTAATVGDEPLLMARQGIEVYVARARAEGAKLIEANKSADVILLDDGFQHRALARDVDIVSVFVGNSEVVEDFIAGELLPLGRFREDRTRGLRRAQMVVLSERRVLDTAADLDDLDPRLVAAMPSNVSVFRSYLQATGVRMHAGNEVLRPREVVACAGIAHPEGFFTSLRSLGFSVLAECRFADHHPFSATEICEIVARYPGIPLVCTAKDQVRIDALELPSEVRAALAVVTVEARVTPPDAFMVQILRRIRQKLPEGLQAKLHG